LLRSGYCGLCGSHNKQRSVTDLCNQVGVFLLLHRAFWKQFITHQRMYCYIVMV